MVYYSKWLIDDLVEFPILRNSQWIKTRYLMVKHQLFRLILGLVYDMCPSFTGLINCQDIIDHPMGIAIVAHPKICKFGPPDTIVYGGTPIERQLVKLFASWLTLITKIK